MKSLAEGLPPEVARRLHPDWRRNEVEYWAVRDQLLERYRDQWVGFAAGSVIVAGASPVEVLHQAQASGQHPFVVCAGREHEPCAMRRASFPYDTAYPGEALPVIRVEFRQRAGSAGVVFDRVIPDTALPRSWWGGGRQSLGGWERAQAPSQALANACSTQRRSRPVV